MQHETANSPARPPLLSDEDVSREELHFRRIDMRGYQRSDGYFELTGRVTDRKPNIFIPRSGEKTVPANEAIHDMGVRLVYDENLTVLDIATFTEASPYPHCALGGQALRSLIGERMSNGWTKAVRSRLGGPRACTHLMEILIPMATTAHQSLSAHNRQKPLRLDANGRPLKIDSCYAYAAHQDVIKQLWPEFHQPLPPVEG
jgi:hypothetical protein